jgi:hypothetical protein
MQERTEFNYANANARQVIALQKFKSSTATKSGR